MRRFPVGFWCLICLKAGPQREVVPVFRTPAARERRGARRNRSGEKKEVKEENYHRRERSFGNFHRAFILPAAADEEKISTSFKDGVMTIDLPKSQQAQKKTKKITIERGK